MKKFFLSVEFQGFFKEILRMIQGRFRAVQMKFPWCFKKVSRVLQKVFGVLRALQGCVKKVSRMF